MATTALVRGHSIDGMAKKKGPGADGHKTKRVNIGVPEQWHAVMRKLAAKGKRSVLFTLIDLVEREATAQGISDLPPLPWEEGDEGG